MKNSKSKFSLLLVLTVALIAGAVIALPNTGIASPQRGSNSNSNQNSNNNMDPNANSTKPSGNSNRPSNSNRPRGK